VLEQIAVSPPARGAGVADALLEEAKQRRAAFSG